MKNNHRSKIFQFKQLERRSMKNSRLQRDSNPWPLRYRCDALPTELGSHASVAKQEPSTKQGQFIDLLNKLTSLPMCGFITQLVDHRTGIEEVTGSNPAEVLIFFMPLLVEKFTAMITLHFQTILLLDIIWPRSRRRGCLACYMVKGLHHDLPILRSFA